MMSEDVSIQLLREENYQLKNQISQLKNAFDLNRDVLRILSQQSRQNRPECKTFYQIIRRLTSLNNQTMIVFADMLSQKCELKDKNRKLANQLEALNETNKELGQLCEHNSNPKEMSLQRQDDMQIWKKDLLLMQEQLVLKQQEIKRLKKLIPNKINQQESDIPFTNSTQDTYENQYDRNCKQNHYKPKKESSCNLYVEKLHYKNRSLTRLVQQLQGRIIILLKALEYRPDFKEKHNFRQQYRPQSDIQLSLLKFALNNMNITNDQQHFKLAVTKRHMSHKDKQKQKSKSMEKLNSKKCISNPIYEISS